MTYALQLKYSVQY